MIERGQFFTRKLELQEEVFRLCLNSGRILEPSAGEGHICSFFKDNGKKIDVCIEVDETLTSDYNEITVMNFFDYDINEKFDTIVGNPPYVKQQLIEKRDKIQSEFSSLNLYLYFIEKCFRHLNHNGEIVFIIPREFLTNSRASGIRKMLYDNGTITDVIDYQERKMFDDADPYVIIIRYHKDNFSHITNYVVDNKTVEKKEIFQDGFIKLLENEGESLDTFFDIKVGIVSGANGIYQNNKIGNVEIICSDFVRTRKRKKYIFYTDNFPNDVIKHLEQFKNRLISRKIKSFNENNWFEWGAVRNLKSMEQDGYCIYVNAKTREGKPFFKEKIGYYDGSVLALIPKDNVDIDKWLDILNNAKHLFMEQGMLVGNKFQFTQKGLSKLLIDKNVK